MDYFIADFPREILRKHCDEIPRLKSLICQNFLPMGFIQKMDFHYIRVEEEEERKEKKYLCRLFIRFLDLKIPQEELIIFKCSKRDFIPFKGEYTFHLRPFRNLEIGDTCLFDIPYTLKNCIKFEESFFPDKNSKPYPASLNKFLKEIKLTFKPWRGKIIKFEFDVIHVESLEDSTKERIWLNDGQKYINITFEGLPVYKLIY